MPLGEMAYALIKVKSIRQDLYTAIEVSTALAIRTFASRAARRPFILKSISIPSRAFVNRESRISLFSSLRQWRLSQDPFDKAKRYFTRISE